MFWHGSDGQESKPDERKRTVSSFEPRLDNSTISIILNIYFLHFLTIKFYSWCLALFSPKNKVDVVIRWRH